VEDSCSMAVEVTDEKTFKTFVFRCMGSPTLVSETFHEFFAEVRADA